MTGAHKRWTREGKKRSRETNGGWVCEEECARKAKCRRRIYAKLTFSVTVGTIYAIAPARRPYAVFSVVVGKALFDTQCVFRATGHCLLWQL